MIGLGLGLPFGRGRAGKSIEEILFDGFTAAYFDFNDTESITKNESNQVTQWADKSGNNRHLLQADTNISPTYTSTGIAFDGTEFLKCAAFTLVQPEYIYLVVKKNTDLSVAGQTKCMMDGNTSNKALLSQTGVGVNRKVNGYAGAWSPANGGMINGQYNIIRYFINGANSKLQVNDELPVEWNAGTAHMGGFTLGARGDGNQRTDMEVKEVIIRTSIDGENQIYSYLNKKYFGWIDKSKDGSMLANAPNITPYAFILSGHQGQDPVVIHYGDGSREYLEMDGEEKTLSHRFPVAGEQNITFYNIDGLKGIRCINSRYYGNLSGFAKAANLELISVGNNTETLPWTGDTAHLSTTLKYFNLGQFNDITGDIGRFVNLLVHSSTGSGSVVTNQNTLYGDIGKCTKLQYLTCFGYNTISGDMSGMEDLYHFYLGGYSTIFIDVTGMTSLRNLETTDIANGCPAEVTGDITGLINLGLPSVNPITGVAQKGGGWLCVAAPNTLYGDFTNLENAVYLSATGQNTITGDVTNMTKLLFLGLGGNATPYGSIENLVNLEVLTPGTITKPSTVINNKRLVLFAPSYMPFTEAEVNQILADFWANRDEIRTELTYNGRIIDLGFGAPPTGQGLIDKANLQAYRSPDNDPQWPLWTVNTAT